MIWPQANSSLSRDTLDRYALCLRCHRMGYCVAMGIGADGKLRASVDSRVHLTELATGRATELQQPPVEEGNLTAVAISGDGRLVISGAQSGAVHLFDRATGQELGSRRASPDGWAASLC